MLINKHYETYKQFYVILRTSYLCKVSSLPTLLNGQKDVREGGRGVGHMPIHVLTTKTTYHEI